ncbi:MAG: hypothetical protein LBT40_02875 [Deltaproteobacteria bacterium]|jgi:predicted helicase|nr:hypothetical protein [Deltaproteobacteria bacterium]
MGDGTPYTPFEGICLTDTFQLYEQESGGLKFTEIMKMNSERVNAQKNAPIMVIVGNPPYSVGQKSANDNAQNHDYPSLNNRISATYAAGSTSQLKKSLFDTYIKAFRWASDRLGDDRPGIIAYVTNAGWLDGNAMDGMRKSLAQEFSSIYVFNLRGNCRLQGEARRKENDNVFGLGSRTPVAVTVLVRNPAKQGNGEILNSDIGDYLTRKKKLEIIKERHDIFNPDMEWKTIVPNDAGDWLNQRSGSFSDLIPLGDKDDKTNSNTFFVPHYSLGLNTSRDAWCYNYSEKLLVSNICKSISFYNDQVEIFPLKKAKYPSLAIDDCLVRDPTLFSWDRQQKSDVQKGKIYSFEENSAVLSSYRPYQKQFCYFNRKLNNCVYQLPSLFPTPDNPNQVICASGIGVTKEFSAIMTNLIPDQEFVGKSMCFPLYWYEEEGDDSRNLFSSGKGKGKVVNGYLRHDGLTDWILGEFRKKYCMVTPGVTKSQIFHYVYGILHSPVYRETFSVDLKKSLPRLPLVPKAQDFLSFAEAGKALAKLHLSYETAKPFHAKVTGADSGRFQVEKMRFGKEPDGKANKSVILFNDLVSVENIPLEAYEYVVNGKSAIEWVMERYQVKTDKDSGIKNNPDDWAKEHGEPRYVLDLLLRVITVSLETMRIVKRLPNPDLS